MPTRFHSVANRAASLSMKVLFGYSSRIHVVGWDYTNRAGGFLLASNHISHFDPPIISSVARRKIDWMAMAEFFPIPGLGHFLKAVDAFPAARDRADRKTIRSAIERLKAGRIVGVFPEGGIRDGARSLLGGAPLRPGASTLAHMAGVPIVPCVILGSDRLYAKRNWLPLRRTRVWIAFGQAISHFPELEKSVARARIEQELADGFQRLYAELRRKFQLTRNDLPHPPRERMRSQPKNPRRRLHRAAANAVDFAMCVSMNLVQSRHRLNGRSAEEMERYVTECEKITPHQYYAAPEDVDLARAIEERNGASVTWRSPIETKFLRNNVARADFFWCAAKKNAPTVFMLHALMSATHIGYRRWAARFNELGWNACFVHLPYHYSRVPRGYWNGELAITADLIRNAEGLRQGVIELRQLMAALRECGCREVGVLGADYGGWVGARVSRVEREF